MSVFLLQYGGAVFLWVYCSVVIRSSSFEANYAQVRWWRLCLSELRSLDWTCLFRVLEVRFFSGITAQW